MREQEETLELANRLIKDADEVLLLTKALEVEKIINCLENWIITTSNEIKLLKDQVEYTVKLVDDK